MLDVVFGENGLIEAKDKKDLKEKVIVCSKLLTDIENEGVKSTPVAVEKFAKYIKDREKTVLRKLIRNASSKAMRISDKSAPPGLDSNQSQTVNSILAAKKCALGYGKKEDVSKFSFIKDIYQSAVEHQSREIEKAIINQSNEYRLNENAAYLHVALETWENWICDKKQIYCFCERFQFG